MTTKKDWIVAVCSSGASGISIRKFHGSEDNAKKILVELVKESRNMDREHFDFGATKVADIVKDEPGVLSAYANFTDYHIEYIAMENDKIQMIQVNGKERHIDIINGI